MSSFFNSLFKCKPAPARLEPKLSFKETYQVELIFLAGLGVIVLLLIFAFMFVGRLESGIYYNGGMV